MATSDQQQMVMRAVERSRLDPAVIASAASVLLSWYFYFVRNDKLSGLFVGLWAPTILAFASHFELVQMRHMMKRGTVGGVVESLERAIQR